MGNKKTVSKSLFVIVVVALAILLVASVCFCIYSRRQYQDAQRCVESYQKKALRTSFCICLTLPSFPMLLKIPTALRNEETLI